jgi:cyclophilin family peptidyl-prolyl cis-trans isomerase
MAELQQAQVRSKRKRRYAVFAAVIVVFLGLAIYVGTRGSSSKTTTSNPPTSSTSAGKSPTAAALGPSAAVVTPAALAALTTRSAPAAGATCSTTAATTPGATTTVPAKGNAVSIVAAPATVGFPKLDGSSPRYTKFAAAPAYCIDASKTYTATMKTDVGTVVIKLLPQYAPQTVNNFVFLAGYHYFDGTVFHRVIPGFVDQGGDPTGTGGGGPGYTIADENPKSAAAYDDGAVAMANTGQPHSGGSQFFLVVGTGGQQLSASYASFGQIVSGLDVAKKINNDGDATDNGSPPKVTHKLLSVTVAAS